MTPVSVIIVGAPRSGTYWVVDLLQARFGIHFPSETHFAPLYDRFLWLFGDLTVASNRRRLLKSLYEFLQIWTVRSSSSREYLSQIRRLSLLVTLDEGCAEQIVQESFDYPSLVESLYRHFARIHGAEVSGDKSAHYRVINPASVFDLFPEALMLHVVRDGRDVALSWIQQWFGPASIADAAWLWRDHIRVNREWGARNVSRYLEVRYEDLALDREDEIRRLEKFLGRPARPRGEESVQSALSRALSATESHFAMAEIEASNNISKWQEQMSTKELLRFEQIAGEVLESCGYKVSLAGNARARRTLPRLTAHQVRVALKTVLPLVLWVCSLARLPLLKIVNRKYPAEWRNVDVDITTSGQ